jgi:hypothetical protein
MPYRKFLPFPQANSAHKNLVRLFSVFCIKMNRFQGYFHSKYRNFVIKIIDPSYSNLSYRVNTRVSLKQTK